MSDSPEISAVFATKNRLAWLKKTMASLYEELEGNFDYEIIVVDGQSTDGTISYLKSSKRLTIILEEEPKGCCSAYDTAFRKARGRWICWLNDDIEIVPGAFAKMMDFVHSAENHRVGMAAFPSSHLPGLLDKFVVHTCFGLPLVYADFGFLRRELLEQIGYLDLSYHKYHWDSDLALKIWEAGRQVVPCPGAHIHHYYLEDEIRLSGEESRDRDYLRFRNKWIDQVEAMAAPIYQDAKLLTDISLYLDEETAQRIENNNIWRKDDGS